MAEVAIILPVWNRASRIAQAVNSALSQKGPTIELMVVDDGSEDDLAAALKPFKHDSRLKVIRQEHAGVSAARNHGIVHTQANLIAFLDSDDYWLSGKLSQQVEALLTTGYSINQCEDIWIRNGVRVNPPKHYQKQGGDLFLKSLHHCMITPSSVLMTRALFLETGGFDPTFPACEDFDLWLRITDHCQVGLIPQALMVRQGGHPDQLSTSVPVQDRYRVQALVKWVETHLQDSRMNLVHQALYQKVQVLEKGYAKRNNADGLQFCNEVIGKYSLKRFIGP